MITGIGEFLLILGLIYLGITAVLINIDINFQRDDVQLRQSN